MKRLLPFEATVYDANCFIYYCLYSTFNHNGVEITLSVPILTEKMRAITEALIENKKLILTTEDTIHEIKRGDKPARIIRSFINRQDIRKILGMERAEPVPAIIELKLIRSLDKKIRGLQGKDWLKVESFVPIKTDIDLVKTFYNALIADPRMQKLCQDKHRSYPYPSRNDMCLMIFAKYKKFPLLTNDRDFLDFRAEIERDGLCVKVVPVEDVVIEA